MATKLLRRNSNQKMWVAIVRTATQNCLECALEAGLEENKVSGHKTVCGFDWSASLLSANIRLATTPWSRVNTFG